MRKLIFALLFIGNTFVPHKILAQCGNTISIDNPSFEGTPNRNASPPNWTPCIAGSVATMPLQPWVNLIPANGSSYLGLEANDCIQTLCSTVHQTLNTPLLVVMGINLTPPVSVSSLLALSW